MENVPLSLQDPIKKIISNDGYTEYNMKIKRFDSGCGHFLGELYNIEIKGYTDQSEKKTNIFIKKRIVLNNINFIPLDKFFLNEAFVYTDLADMFTYLQDIANVPLHDRYKIAKAYDVTSEDAIILEDLSKKHFKTYKHEKVFPLKYAELAIKELAKFHALSFVIEYKVPEFFNKKIKPLNNLFCYDEDWRKYMGNVCKYIANMYDDKNEVKKKIENFLPVMLEKFPQYNTKQSNIRCALTHGDYKMNNILVRELDGKPVEIVAVDYQIIDYGCPIRDFLFFVFSGSDQEFRRKNLNNLKEVYFTSLANFLKYFDLDVEIVYPRREFEKVYSEWLDYGLMMSLLASSFIFVSEGSAEVEEMSLSEIPLNFNERAKHIIRGWVEDFVQWGYL